MRLVQSGPRTAKIVCVGEAPGANEDEKGKPFVGASGDDLNRYLADIGLRRASYDSRIPDYDAGDDVFVTNVVHARPPNNKFEAFVKPKPSPHLFMGILQLKKDLEEIRPNLVIAFGDVPMRYLTNKHGIGKYRGSILPCTLAKGLKVIPTYHPASVFRIYENKALIQLDMKRMKEESAYPELNLPQRKIYIWGMHELFDVDLPTVAAEMYNSEWLSVDIETEPKPGRHEIICVGFSDRPDRALVVPRGSPGGAELIRRLCASPAKKCGQNAGPYDKVVLEDNGIPLTNFAWDIMYSHHALLMEAAGGGDEVKDMRGTKKTTAVLKKGLGFQVSIYTREPYYKDDGKLWKIESGDIKDFYFYCGKDAACAGEIRQVHDKELDAFNVRHVFEHEMKLLPMLSGMTRRGVRIDLPVKASLKAQYEGEIANLNKFFEAQTGSVLNVKSPPQMQKLLYETLGLPVKYHRETKRPTANKDAILELAAKYEHPVLMAILEIRKRRDLIERYLDAGVDADGRMRCLFDPSGTRTGRLASRANIYGSGTNLQNIPPKLRRMFVADPGKVFFYVDLSQAEARVVAWLARCESLIELFTSGRDIHKENAIRFFGEYKEETRISVKRIVHGSNYGEGIDRIVQVAAADGIKLLRTEVALGQEAYFMLYPEIKENWWADVRRDLRYRLLTTPLGWKRQFYGRWDSQKFFNEGLAFQPQCTVGVLAEMGMMACQDVPDSEILLNAHDAVLGQCDEDKAAVVVPAIVKAMEIPLMIHGKELIIPADAKVGRNWEEASDGNPEGLKKWAR